jgi:hypothetical protein
MMFSSRSRARFDDLRSTGPVCEGDEPQESRTPGNKKQIRTNIRYSTMIRLRSLAWTYLLPDLLPRIEQLESR